jgi:hypothetical protein
MKRQNVFGTAISLLVLIVLISGCTSGQTGGPSATGMPSMDMSTGTATPAAATTPAISPGPASGQGVTSTSLFDHAGFTWYQYEISSGTMGMPMTHTYKYSNATYQEQPARHANITMDMLPAMLIYLDIWSNAPGDRTFNIHEIAYENGKQTKDADIDAANYTKWEVADLASPKFTTASLQPAGTESLTLGSKTYVATKYAGIAGEQQYTYWVSREVPVPLKLLVHDAKGDTIYELAGWG